MARLLASVPVAAVLVLAILFGEPARPAATAPQDIPIRAPARQCTATYYHEHVICDGAVGHWRLGESSGTTAADSSGLGQNGTYTGSVTLGVAGAITFPADTAISLPGDGGDYVTIPDSVDLSPSVGSWEAWVYLTSLPATSAAPMTKQSSQYRITISSAGIPSCGATIGATQTSGTFRSVAASGAGLSLNTWHHLACTFDGTTLRTYVDAGDGVADGSGAFSGVLLDTAGALIIGDLSTTTSCTCRLDEVAVYPSALSGSQISTHYSVAGLSATATPTATPVTPTATPTNTGTPTNTSTPTQTPTNTPTPTNTLAPTNTPTPYTRCHLGVEGSEEIAGQGSITVIGVNTLDGCAPGSITIQVGVTPTPVP